MKLPRPDLSFLKKIFNAKTVLYGGITLFMAGFAVLGWMYYYGRNDTTALDAEKTLIVASIEAQQNEIRAGREALQREQDRLDKEQTEYRKLLGEMQLLEKNMDKLMAARYGRETAEEAAIREAKHKAEEERRRREEERLRKLAEEERLRQLAEAAKDTLDLTNINKLTKIYEAMRPAKMAGIIKELREDLALQVLIRMEERKVARLFATLDPVQAASLSGKLNELKKKGE